jgi:hypothetical protein
VRYYADLKDATSVESHADVHMNLTLGKTRVALSQGAQNTPYYGFRFFPNVGSDEYAMPSDGVQPVRSTQTYLFNTTAAITQTLTTRSELFASYALRYTDFARPGTTDLTAHSARAGYRYQLTRYAAFRAGYGIEQGTYGYAALARDGRTRLDTIDLGVDYHRPLSFSRRTRVDFGVGTTAADVPLGGRVYRLVGDAGLTHEIGRTWNLRASVHRGTSLIEGIAGPVFSDAGTVSFAGFVNRRLDVHTEGSYTTGEVGMTGERSPFDSMNGLGRLRFALSRKVALFGEYSYYRYHFRSAAALPTGLPPNLRRQGVRVGVTLFIPVLHGQVR